MTNESIDRLIDSVNEGTGAARIFIQPLLGNVRFARAWLEEPQGSAWNESGYDFYLVDESQGGKCAGAVLDMVWDLHVFTKTECRRRGLMYRALNEIILPHIFSRGRKEQKVSVSSEEGRRLLAKLGFTINDGECAELSAAQSSSAEFPVYPTEPLSETQMRAVQRSILRASSWLKLARDSMGKNASEDLLDEFEQAINCVQDMGRRVRDDWDERH